MVRVHCTKKSRDISTKGKIIFPIDRIKERPENMVKIREIDIVGDHSGLSAVCSG